MSLHPRSVATVALAATLIAASGTLQAVTYGPGVGLLNPTPSASDAFGHEVAAAGVHVLIGTPGKDTGATDAGEAYLFDTSGAQLHTFLNPSPGAGDGFGTSVAVIGTNVLVGAPAFDVSGATGRVHMFDGDPASGTFGTLLHTFLSGGTDDAFGTKLAVAKTELLVGAPQDDTGATDSGKAYLFDADPTSGTFGTVLQSYLNPTPGVDERFGGALGMVGPDPLISSHSDDTSATNSGETYLFSRSTGLLVQTFSNPTPAMHDFFGVGVAGVGGKVLVGSQDDVAAPDAGAAYLFDTSATLLQTFFEPTPVATHLFGGGRQGVAAVGTYVLVGAAHYSAATTGGAVYLFDQAGTLLASFSRPTALGGDAFGNSLAAHGTDVLVGASGDDAGATDAGAVYFFPNLSCGDGVVDGGLGEECDDGNTTAGDGCDAGCAIEIGCTCSGAPSVCTCFPPIGVVGTKLIALDNLALAGKAKVVYVSKDLTAGITKGPATGQTVISASFTVSYDDVSGTFLLPSGASNGTDGWKLNSTVVAKYVNKAAPSGPTGAKVAVIKPGKLLKIVGKSLGDSPIDLFAGGPPDGKITTVFTITNGAEVHQHCSEFDPANPAHVVVLKEIAGGTGRKLVAKRGDPATCP